MDSVYMLEALKEAQRAFDSDEVPVGAVIVHEGKIIGRAHNQIKLLKDPTAHAEMIAITQAAQAASSEERQLARQHFTAGTKAYDLGQFAEAQLAYGRAIRGAEASQYWNEAGLACELRLGAVLVEACHGKEILRGKITGGAQRNQGVRVARISNDEHFDGLLCATRNGFTLADENLAVDAEEVFALHTVLPGHGADEQAPVGVFKAFVQIAGSDHVSE